MKMAKLVPDNVSEKERFGDIVAIYNDILIFWITYVGTKDRVGIENRFAYLFVWDDKIDDLTDPGTLSTNDAVE